MLQGVESWFPHHHPSRDDIIFGVFMGAPKHSPQDDHFVPHDGHLVNLNFGIHAVL